MADHASTLVLQAAVMWAVFVYILRGVISNA